MSQHVCKRRYQDVPNINLLYTVQWRMQILIWQMGGGGHTLFVELQHVIVLIHSLGASGGMPP